MHNMARYSESDVDMRLCGACMLCVGRCSQMYAPGACPIPSEQSNNRMIVDIPIVIDILGCMLVDHTPASIDSPSGLLLTRMLRMEW